MFPRFLIISIALCRCLHVWRASHLFRLKGLTLVKELLLQVGVCWSLLWFESSGVVCHVPWYGEVLDPGRCGVLLAQALRILHPTSCDHWVRTVESLQWLQGLMESLAVLLGPATWSQGRWWWRLQLIVCTCLSVEAACRLPVWWQGTFSDPHAVAWARASTGARVS